MSKQSRGQVRLNPDDGKLGTALKKEFGHVYEYLFQDMDGAQFDFMREEFGGFLTDRLHSQFQPAASNSSAFALGESSKYISQTDARRSLKLTNKELFNLMARGEIRCVVINGKQSPELGLNVADIERLKCEFEQYVTARDLAKQLGLDREGIRELVQKGLLRTRPRRSSDGFSTLRFGHNAAKEFLRSVTSGKTPQ
ncbi:MAG TPA: hypothetical protein VK582_04535 [Pyrinomonadaceae bacterium]|nr:hypothetical protein [Pyrinomonadaceae bacterium]